jgi:adenosine/AMP kinase
LNVLNSLKAIPEVCHIYCATANPAEVLIAETAAGRAILGIVDGARPQGIEADADIAWRRDLLKKIGYKQ